MLLWHSHIHLKVYASKLEHRACKRLVLRKVIKVNEERPLFQLFFLKEDEDQNVEVEEIDFREVGKRLKQGKCGRTLVLFSHLGK